MIATSLLIARAKTELLIDFTHQKPTQGQENLTFVFQVGQKSLSSEKTALARKVKFFRLVRVTIIRKDRPREEGGLISTQLACRLRVANNERREIRGANFKLMAKNRSFRFHQLPYWLRSSCLNDYKSFFFQIKCSRKTMQMSWEMTMPTPLFGI